MNNLTNILIILVLVLATVAFLAVKANIDNTREYRTANSFLTGELNTYKDKYGREVAEKNLIEVSNYKMFLEIENLKGAQKELQDLIKKNKNSSAAVIIKTETKVDTVLLTQVDTTKGIWPVYKYEMINDWVDLRTISTFDSTSVSLRVFNSVQLLFTNPKFSRKPAVVQLVNENPYTVTTDLEGYIVKVPKPKFSLGVGVQYGINSDLRLVPSLGIGVYYNVISF